MPKEQINYPKAIEVRVAGSNDPSTAPTLQMQPPVEPEFSLHWLARDGIDPWVQLGCDFDVATVKALIDGSPNTTRLTIYSDTLDRQAMQRLIRAARRSRDAVHGADE